MSELASIAEDLAFVRQRVVQASQRSFPSTILYLWAGIVALGAVLADVSPPQTGIFWLIMGPTGGIASAFLGHRWALTRGQDDSAVGLRHALHWGGLLAGLTALMIPMMTGQMGTGAGALPLLLVSLAYYYAGVHMHRSLLWLAGLQFLAYVITSIAPGLPQTFTGVTIAIGFVWVGLAAQRPPQGTSNRLRLEQ